MWLTIVLFFITGVVSGTFGGLLGIGGASILVPALTLIFGLPIHLAIGVSLLNNVVVSFTATMRYRKQGLLSGKVILIMNVGSVAGIIIGTFLATRSPEAFLKALFGAFLMFMAANAFLHRNAVEGRPIGDPSPEEKAALSGLGFIMGLLGALLGLGGGTVAVPVLNTLFRMPLKYAIANSLATIIVSSSLGALIYFWLSSGTLFSAEEALMTAIAIIPGSAVGARAGAVLSERLHARYIKYIFYALLLYIAYNMIKSGLGW
ncbi:putative permease [Methanocella conradii HZ254]|uniref:Probable membrane transporter protein n=1 Tax=Methanocella conradii (strain DSM 24694 / JCM 17849 / CGMCC 1.5162 / HZ254) TaxID=1041930 RepID=H8I4F6_METCZ|nr:sulfite exporter TauE/SafE family protein [Methanocella conradii]AFC99713.1 putative permease [Methanocella conradii HZ254]MDI6896572.1 sulfite exporter TauE/SafE family protein [Methanocella conradii]